MKIALAQLNYTVGAIESNKTKIINNIRKAREQGAELVVFAEQAISGTPCYELLNISSFLSACEDALVEIASHCDEISVLVGLPLQNDNQTISAAAFIQNRHVVKYIGKKNISSSRDDMGYINPSKGCEYITVAGNKIAVVLGEDIMTEREYENAKAIVSINASRYYRGVIETRYDYLSNFTYTTGKSFVGVNQIGGNVDLLYDGSSMVFNKKGKLTGLLKSFEEDFVVIDTESEVEVAFPPQNRTENIYKAINLGLKDYFEKNGFTKACLGMSGGIDSAVVLAMAVEALGAENVRVLMMPSEFSSDHSVTDSVEMVEQMGVEYDVIPITETFRTVRESMIPILGGTKFNVTEENMQARIRMIMLMALSNKFGHILLNTSNKSELAVGYGTLYGDCAGSLSVIGDLYKNEVYSLARYINRYSKVIPDDIISKEPSAELRPGQKDSDSLPAYEVLDAILYRFIEEGQLVYEIIDAGFDDEMVHRILKMIRLCSFKREQSCPVLRLSLKPFGSGYRLPLLNHFII